MLGTVCTWSLTIAGSVPSARPVAQRVAAELPRVLRVRSYLPSQLPSCWPPPWWARPRWWRCDEYSDTTTNKQAINKHIWGLLLLYIQVPSCSTPTSTSGQCTITKTRRRRRCRPLFHPSGQVGRIRAVLDLKVFLQVIFGIISYCKGFHFAGALNGMMVCGVT